MKATRHFSILATCALVGLFLLQASTTTVCGAEADFATIEKQFRELPLEARQQIGPLFWLHGDDRKERLEMYVGKVAEGGNGAFTTESRPHNDWLGPKWFRDVAICLEAAKQHGLKLWIFDEQWWPSQGVGGKVPARYAAKQLHAVASDVEGAQTFEAVGFAGEGYVGAVAGRVIENGAIDGNSLVDLAPFIREGKLAWPVPAGRWKIMKFTHVQAPGLGQGGGKQLSVDGMSKDCVEWFLQTVYQPHYDRFNEDFGKTVAGFFYDEPETRGDWGTELNAVLAERDVDWKKAYVAYKFRLSEAEQAAARYQYLDARAEAWGRTMYGGITKWCEAHGVKSIGHFMEHANLYLQQDFCAGDLMRLQKYSSMGGIDAVFSQFKPGQRAAYDAPCWQTPKLGSSITHAYGKPDDVTMVEIFGARGQDLTYPEMKWWADHMHVSGVNFLIPHSFNPRSPHDTDCPPYFYNGGFEPRWPLYRVFADYSSRLSVLLSGGRHVAPVALLSLGQSAHVGQRVTLEQISESLQDALYDCDWLPYEVFENDMRVAGKELNLRHESYRILVVPPVEVIPYATMAKAKEFFDSGGVVLTHGFLPTKSATLGKTAADIAELRDAIWGSATPSLAVCKQSTAGGRSYLLPGKPTPEQLQQVLGGDAGIHPTLEVLAGKTDHWLHVLHRVKAGRDVFFIANQNHLGEARQFRFRITAEGQPECWDPMRDEISAVPFERKGRQVELSLTMEPNESVLLVFQPNKRSLPMRLESGAGKVVASIPVARDAAPPRDEPVLEAGANLVRSLEDCSWVWYPEGYPVQSAPAATRYFRKRITLPADRTIKKATFVVTADNSARVFVNGQDAGHSDDSANGWRNPVELDVTTPLHIGPNQIAIAAANASTALAVNPAGLIGKLTVEFASGPPLTERVDKSWKAGNEMQTGWTEAAFNDTAWPAARETVRYGAGPWGRFSRSPFTVSPAKADPFFGHCEIPAGLNLARTRVCLELNDLAPEAAARVTVNDQYAGGMISKPFRLDITKHLRPGVNNVRLEPFAPSSARLVVRE
jgi:hypothetical protein